MELKEQVCSLELAKKLKSLNCKQESLFYWGPVPKIEGSIVTSKVWDVSYKEHLRYFGKKVRVSAFTVAEIFQFHYEKFGTIQIPVEVSGSELADFIAREYIKEYENSRNNTRL